MVSDFSLKFKDVSGDVLVLTPAIGDTVHQLELFAEYSDESHNILLYFNAETVREIRDVLDFWLKEVDNA